MEDVMNLWITWECYYHEWSLKQSGENYLIALEKIELNAYKER